MAINIQSYVDLATRFIEANLLPDTCNIYPIERTNDGSGGWTEEAGENREYLDDEDIPCRLDPTRQYRDQTVFNQEITVTDYNLNIPRDCPVEVDDEVLHNSIRYVIKKLTDDQSWRSVKRLYVVRVS
jgi:hypothetical protein